MSEHSLAHGSCALLKGACALALSATLIVAPTGEAFATTAAQKQAEAAEALQKMDALNSQLNQAEYDFELALHEQNVAHEAMEDAQTRIDEATDQIADLQEKLGVRARSMYRTGNSTFIDLLLGSTTFQAFTTNWGILNDMNESDAEMVQQTKDLRVEIEDQKAEYAAQEAVAAENAKKAEEVKNSAQNLVNEMQATYNSLSEEAAQLLAAEEAARVAAITNNTNNGGNNGGGNNSSSGNNTYYDNYPTTVGGDAVSRAYSMIDKPYSWGAGGPGSFDCSGFVSFCLTGSTGRVYSDSWAIGAAGKPVSNPQAGDVVYWDGHVGLYVGGGMMVHASQSKGKVVEAEVAYSESALGKAQYLRF